MRLWKSWIVTTKDFSVFRKNRYITTSLIAIPLFLGLGASGFLFLLPFLFTPSQLPLVQLTALISLCTWYFVLDAVVFPMVIASYSFVGEKLEKSLRTIACNSDDGQRTLAGQKFGSHSSHVGRDLSWSCNLYRWRGPLVYFSFGSVLASELELWGNFSSDSAFRMPLASNPTL